MHLPRIIAPKTADFLFRFIKIFNRFDIGITHCTLQNVVAGLEIEIPIKIIRVNRKGNQVSSFSLEVAFHA